MKYLIIALLVMVGLITITIISILAAGWLPETEVLVISGIIVYVTILKSGYFDIRSGK